MPDSHLYFGAENVDLTNPQRDTLVSALRALGRQGGELPFLITHHRVRLDNQAAIFEAVLDTSIIDLAAMKTRIANIMGVAENTISTTVSNPSFGGGTSTLVVWRYYNGSNDVVKVRTVAFGTLNGTYEESRLEVIGYLRTNAAAWGDV